jgi:hypothetical protein
VPVRHQGAEPRGAVSVDDRRGGSFEEQHSTSRIGLALGLFVLCSAPASGQSAWLPVDGEANISFVFQHLNFGGHFDENGVKLDGAVPSRAFLGIFQVEYGLTDKLAITARLPYIASEFTGEHDEPVTAYLRDRYDEFQRANPQAAVSTLDTGGFYSTFQDFGFTLRYNMLDDERSGLVITPVIGATIPSHHYRTVGEAAPGQDLLALHTGVNAGRLLDPWLPNAYIHGRYVYSFVESLVNVSMNRSLVEIEGGYGITPTVTARGLATWSHSHGGVPFSKAYDDVLLFLVHDRLLASRYWHVGGGATVSLTDSLDLDGAFVTFLSGSDTHYGHGATIGLTWRFVPSAPATSAPSAASTRQRSPRFGFGRP